MNFNDIFQNNLKKTIKEATDKEIYYALLNSVKEAASIQGGNPADKKVYYISAEFLIGKLLSNNLINLGVFDEIKELLNANGKDIAKIEEVEPEPSLGNGGLGRLAACFLDSIATLGINGDGVGLNYHFGLFKQVFEDNKQTEFPNPWIEKTTWLSDTGVSFDVEFNNFTLKSKMYDIDVIGYNNGTNKLHLFDVTTLNEDIVNDGINFNKEDIKQNLTLFLYPDDSDKKGELLRIYQQYFMVSNAAQLILFECEQKGYDLKDLAKHVVVQINDTHPSLVIPELIRLLVARGFDTDKAIEIVSNTCAYTNHTILAEALEKWPLSFLEEVVAHLVPIIKDLAKRIEKKYPDNKELYIIDKNNRVHMARMDMHYGFSVNGVAALHTDILKANELNDFYKIYPEKFNNKTNGITFRRWLLHSNAELVNFIDKHGLSEFRKDATELKKLAKLVNDKEALNELLKIKHDKKIQLKNYLKVVNNTDINENSIFDIQIKRLHEYKRQQMNILYIIYKYLEIKKGNKPSTPITIIFGAKAAPAYKVAKDIIHVILCLKKLIEDDKEVSQYLQVVMVENYNVTHAEKLIPACDVSEQISLASKEASGTGNMKFMLNGAITLGTEDGANVEIHELVGDDNIYIFGKDSDTIIDMYKNSSYKAVDYYINDADIRTWLDFIISPAMLKIGDVELLLEIHAELIRKDYFMTLIDVKDYIKVKEEMFKDYEDRETWAKKMLINISEAGYFSSDRTIAQYNKDIWHIDTP
ncbi:MAG: maltose phosphorylase [Epulopiscium sp. Nuni2H_MBin003]|nr:MAG: maltose phosphorylase [Epulopiscium sp. Nuni2H_MBin003]